MSDDIVTRLRELDIADDYDGESVIVLEEAAAEIERLRAENERLKSEVHQAVAEGYNIREAYDLR
jgi:hypothetical protein